MATLKQKTTYRPFASSLAKREALWFYALVLPWLTAFIAFTLIPMVTSLYLAFTKYNAIDPPQFIGLTNFRLLFHDPLFWKSVKVTALYTVVFVPVQLATSLMLAILLNLRVPAMRLIRAIYYLPSILPEVITGLVWVYLFNPNFGPINYLIYITSRVNGPNWLGSEQWVLPAVIISGLWGMGSGVIIFLASLQSIPRELYESAELDGAGILSRFWSITIPMVSPVVLFNLLMGSIGALQIFARIYVLTGGGPNYGSYVYNLYLYNNAFGYFKLGLASAQAWLLFVVIMVVTAIILKTSQRWVYYAGGT